MPRGIADEGDDATVMVVLLMLMVVVSGCRGLLLRLRGLHWHYFFGFGFSGSSSGGSPVVAVDVGDVDDGATESLCRAELSNALMHDDAA